MARFRDAYDHLPHQHHLINRHGPGTVTLDTSCWVEGVGVLRHEARLQFTPPTLAEAPYTHEILGWNPDIDATLVEGLTTQRGYAESGWEAVPW